MVDSQAKRLIEEFAEKQQGGHFACPRCGRTMGSENVTHNALSRRIDVYICDTCGMQEALEDLVDRITPLSAWAITQAPEKWGITRHYTAEEWAHEQYTGRWDDTPYQRDRVEAGEVPASYTGRRTLMVYNPSNGGVQLLTEGYHFTVDDEEGRRYL